MLHIDLRPGRAVKIGNAPVYITGESGRGISGYYNLDRGRVEWVRLWCSQEEEWVSNHYITRLKTGSQLVGDQMSWREDAGLRNMSQRDWAPSWATKEIGKETRLWPIEWGSICVSSVRSPTPSHTQPFQIKWEVYFSKELCCSSLSCRCVIHTDVYVLCGYTTEYDLIHCQNTNFSWMGPWHIYEEQRSKHSSFLIKNRT